MLDSLVKSQHMLRHPRYYSSMGSLKSTGLALLIPRASKATSTFRERESVSTCIRLRLRSENPIGGRGLELTFKLSSVHVRTFPLNLSNLDYATTSSVLPTTTKPQKDRRSASSLTANMLYKSWPLYSTHGWIYTATSIPCI